MPHILLYAASAARIDVDIIVLNMPLMPVFSIFLQLGKHFDLWAQLKTNNNSNSFSIDPFMAVLNNQ